MPEIVLDKVCNWAYSPNFEGQVSSLRSQLARPGATEVGQCFRKKNPVWAREYWTRSEACAHIGMVDM